MSSVIMGVSIIPFLDNSLANRPLKYVVLTSDIMDVSLISKSENLSEDVKIAIVKFTASLPEPTKKGFKLEISRELEKAYRNTDYFVFADPEFVIEVDRHSPELQKLMIEKKFTQAAFISACAPYSDLVEESLNIQAHASLTEELNELDFDFIPAFGKDQNDLYPGEESILVLNMPKKIAQALGNKYKQNAILWIEQDAIPRLLFLEGQSG